MLRSRAAYARREVIAAGPTLLGAAVLSRLLDGSSANAAEPWPTSSIQIVVPFPPGGSADLAAWPAGAEINRQFGVPVSVEYRAGEAGAIGNAYVAHAKPDGGTLLVSVNSVAYLPEARQSSGLGANYEMTDLVPIARIISDPMMLVVPANSPWPDADALLKDLRVRPNQIAFSSAGVFSPSHVAMSMMLSARGLTMRHIPSQGLGTAVKVLLAGQVQAVALTLGLISRHLREGLLRVLASWGTQRDPRLPDIPTFAELGMPDVRFFQWDGLFAPAGLPEALVLRLREAMRVAASQRALIDMFKRAGSAIAYMDAPEFTRFIAEDRERVLKVIRQVQISDNR